VYKPNLYQQELITSLSTTLLPFTVFMIKKEDGSLLITTDVHRSTMKTRIIKYLEKEEEKEEALR
jgi:hypothetical protein